MMTLPLADRFQALADPTRLRVLALLRLMELSVGELAQILGQSQPRVSRHLKILGDAGVLDRRKEGSWVFLTLADAERAAPLFALIDRWADAATERLFAFDAARTESIRSERAEAANRYFAGHAEVWDQIRSLDFAAHDREELRATDAHIRLGFQDDVMAAWFAAAGLQVDQVQHLEGGELTVTLWRGLKAAAKQRRAA